LFSTASISQHFMKKGKVYAQNRIYTRMAVEKGKRVVEKTGEVTGKAAKDVAEGTKSFVKGLKKGFGKKEEK